MITKEQLLEIYMDWCEETERTGSVLIGKSIREFINYAVPLINQNEGVFRHEIYFPDGAFKDQSPTYIDLDKFKTTS